MLPNDAFSARIGAMRQSLIRKVFDCKKSTSINLGLGQPSESVPLQIIDEGMRRLKQGDMGYTANAGMLTLRDKIARSHHLPFAGSAENVVVTCGAQEAIVAAMAACLDVGDEVIVADPSFPGYAMAAEFLGAQVVTAQRFESEDFRLNTGALAGKISSRTRLVVLNSPGNPTGKCDTEAELQALAELADKHNFFILCDEIYADILYTQSEMPSATQFSKRAILVSGLSKNVAMTGFRLGYLIAPDPLALALTRAHAVLTSCAPTLSQHMAGYVFENPQLRKVHLPLYAERRQNAINALRTHLPHTPHTMPDGAFYILLNCARFTNNSLDFALQILEQTDVLTTPGLAFGESTRQWLRLSFAGTPENFTTGVERLAPFFKIRATD
ncbi:MAG: pyridoxal phosphate-dependent aminotransferase [Candidatus Riflebacteria bacterium]|jgi:aspartate/methionine/tyrosine aminotransferase|nr:pyridoxal phosphate-dependent aminotransferase [Candidatus Riflebacteria bacterium]